MNFFTDVYKFISYLTLVDIVFFSAIVALLILLVTLIYFIKINREDDNDDLPPSNDIKKEEDVKMNRSAEVDILNSIQNNPPEEHEYNDEEGELLDLESLTKKLQQEQESSEIDIREYEKDQEEKAIISYDELLQKQNRYAINYEKEEVMDDLVVKKVNLNDLVNKDEYEEAVNVRVISYKREEAFLNALKELQSLLN